MEYITIKNVAGVVVGVILIGLMYVSYTLLQANAENRMAIQQIIDVLGASTIVELGPDSEVVVNKVVRQKDITQ